MLYRLETEYGAEPKLDPAPFQTARWFDPGVTYESLAGEYLGGGVKLARDLQGAPVLLFPSAWAVDYFAKEHPKLRLHSVSPKS